MLMPRLVPSLNFRNGRLVKGVHYADHKDAGRPDTIARAYNAQGADELVLVDIDASAEGRAIDLDVVRAVAQEIFMPLTAGGGVRSEQDARDCLGAGADKIMLTMTARDDPSLIDTLARIFGRQAVVLGVDVIDIDGTVALFDHRTGSVIDGVDPGAWIAEGIARGAGEIRLMNVSKEGTRSGMDIELMRRLRAEIRVPVILEGGAGTLDHLSDGLSAGADAVACGTMLVFSDNNLLQIKKYLASKGHKVRH